MAWWATLVVVILVLASAIAAALYDDWHYGAVYALLNLFNHESFASAAVIYTGFVLLFVIGFASLFLLFFICSLPF